MDTLETKTADTILQQPVEVEIGGKTYSVAPPSTATLILVSAAVSKLPKTRLDAENIATESLYIAKDCEALGEIVAILILGAKGLKGSEKKFFGLKTVETDPKSILAKEILTELTPRQLSDMLGKLLAGMDLAFFFATTNSLIEINLLRKTRETETTASGR
ncbi:MAG: hypothetical protein LBL07_12570 [Tannerella sp.]|jgi:hypothetical protein|nr:hypothetical protein [Tannerella sp.]